MRGDDRQHAALFSDISPEERVAPDHPLRTIRGMVETVLKELSPRFEQLYARLGRPSIAPETLRRALLLPVRDTVRRERLLREQLDDNWLLRWFVGLNRDEAVWDPAVCTTHRDRLLAGDVAQACFEQVLAQARARQLLSDEHFTVDGTLIEAWAGQQSLKRRGAAAPQEPPEDPGNPSLDFRGERRTHATHASTTAPAARLSKKAKGHEAQRRDLGPVLLESRHGVVVNTCITQATGTAGRDAALSLAEAMPARHRVTLGADQHDETRACVRGVRERQVTPPVAQHTTPRSSAIAGRTTRPVG